MSTGHVLTDKAADERYEEKASSTPPRSTYDEVEHVGFRTWAVIFAASLQYTGFALILTSSGFYASAIIADVGGADKRLWISSVWIPVSACLALPFARYGDLMGRRYIWILANIIGALGNFLVAGGNSVGMIITGVALWGVCFGNAGNVLASAEIVPRRHRGTANMLYQIGGYGGTTIALLAGARLITDSNNWRALFYLTAAIHLAVAVLLAVFYQPPPVDAKGLSYGQRLGQIDWIGCTLFAGGILLVLVGLTLGGQVAPWNGAETVATLVIGFAMLVALAGHQLFVKRDGIFRKELFQNRNLALCLFGIFTEGFAYIIFNSYYGVQVGTLWDATTFGLALRFCAFVWAAAVASLVYIVIAYRYRAIKELMIWGFAVFLIAAICFATADQNSSKSSIGFAVLAAIGISSPLSFIFAAAQLSIDPAFAGQAMGLLVALRQAGGSIGPAACSAVYTNKITEKLPAYIASAAVAAGLPASSLSTFVPALAAGNATLAAQSTGANAAIIGAAGAAATQAYVESFRYVWYIVIPFAFISLIAMILLKPFKDEMTQVVDRPLEAELHHHDVEKH